MSKRENEVFDNKNGGNHDTEASLSDISLLSSKGGIELLLLYALWSLNGVGTIDEIREFLENLGKPVSKPHLIRVVNKLERNRILIKLRLKELAQLKSTYISSYISASPNLEKRINDIIRKSNPKSVVLILKLPNEGSIKDLVERAKKELEELERKKRELKIALERLVESEVRGDDIKRIDVKSNNM